MLNPQYDPICNIGITPIMPPIIVPSAYTPVYASGTAMTSFVFFVAFGTTLFSILPTRAVNSAGRHESGHQLFAPHASTCTLEDLKDATQRFSRLLQFETVSDRTVDMHALHPTEFKALHDFVKGAYPEVAEALTMEEVGEGGLSLLFTWEGTQPDLEPMLFISHLDVVPVAAGTLDQWTHPPFSGAIADGYIWGRGALDVKIGVCGLLEAVTLLLKEGWKPTRTVLLGFGQDEEVGGDLGAGRTAELLAQRGIKTLDGVFDEGTTILVDGFQPYTSRPVALVSTAEKGYFSVRVRVTTQGGHSSVPPIDHTSAGTLAGRVLTALDSSSPSPALVPPVTDFLKAIAPLVSPSWLQTLFSHPEKPGYADRILNAHLLVDTPYTAALAHTTVAVTGLSAYVGDNVLPPTADITVNFRLLPGATVEGDGPLSVMQYLRDTLGPDLLKYISIEAVRPEAGPEDTEATPVTPADGRHFRALQQAIQENWVLGGGSPITVAPFMLTGGTDSKHYISMSRGGVLRFCPTSTNRTAGDGARVHGLNERLSIQDLGRAICTYRRAIQLLAGEEEEESPSTS